MSSTSAEPLALLCCLLQPWLLSGIGLDSCPFRELTSQPCLSVAMSVHTRLSPAWRERPSTQGPPSPSTPTVFTIVPRQLCCRVHCSRRALHYAAASGKPDWVRWLLKQGANVNQQDAAGNTALHAAAHMGQPECVRVLLNQKADCTLNNTM